MNCLTIPAGKPFVKQLAGWILGEYGADQALLPKTFILLPNRRSCRALREAFLEVTGGKPLLLPRIEPLGDMDEDAITVHLPQGIDLPPAISPLRRELLLTRLVHNFAGRYNIEQAAELARQLARFMDDVAREGLNFDRLSSLAPEELAAHWQQTVDFLALISQHWPRILEAEGALDPVEHRNRLLKATAQAWEKSPPDYPIIAAGSTGSQPATAALLAAIARLPQGTVILPGLDRDMQDAEWEMIGETHPQYGMKRLLEGMGCERGGVTVMPHSLRHLHPLTETPQQARGDMLRIVLQPPEATSCWKQIKLPLAEGLSGVRLLTADTLLDEARLVAVALREVLETPGKTAALVTPDRTLARMVASQMQRFGINIDDSAGYRLMDTPPGCFLRLATELAASGAAPAPLLALLRHPIAAAAREPAECRRLSRMLEISLLRGIRRVSGFDALADAAGGTLKPWLAEMTQQAQAFFACFKKKEVALRDILNAHIQFAEWIASTDGANGAARLWAGDAGNELAAFMAELVEQAELLPQIDPLAYSGLFETLLSSRTYRPRFGLHPRLHILSPMEARLLHFDRVILGGLNEGAWPSAPAADPWMSRPMRKKFGLPPAERDIGQSAHDFTMLAAAPEAILSRARKVEGAPTVPSRWLVRLETLVNGLDPALLDSMRCDAHYGQGRTLLDTPADIPAITRPAPVPPLEARPRTLRVTAIDQWLRDPYMIYAHYILKLKKLEPLDREPDAADFGTLAHRALERFIAAWPKSLPQDAYDKLLECGRAAFADFIDRPSVACLWWPRFEAMAEWLLDTERKRRNGLAQVLGELKGEWRFELGGKPFALTTRIDRMEVGVDGALTLIDYKTGYVPTQAEIDRGLANQLPLEALIVRYGALIPAVVMPHSLRHLHPLTETPQQARGDIQRMEYWKLAGNAESCDVKPVNPEQIAYAKERLEALIRRFDDAATPYAAPADPSLAARFNDYEHLTRREEWEAV